MNRAEVLQKYYDKVAVDSRKAREELLKLDYAEDGYLLSQIALTYRDEAIFFKNGSQRKKILRESLVTAKEYIDKAFKLEPDCRDVLYLKGKIYNALGDPSEAMDCFIKIIELGESLDKKQNCSESDKPYVKMLVNDAHLQLYRLFKATAPDLANKFLKRYKEELGKGTNTIYLPLEDFL